MLLKVISSPDYVKNETEIVNTLFAEGLDCFHLRKPNDKTWEVKSYLSRILPMYHKYIVVHGHYEIVSEFGLRGVHLTRHFKKGKRDLEVSMYIDSWHERGFNVSTTVHDMDELLANKLSYDYLMATPVFESISRPGHLPIEPWNIKPMLRLIKSTTIAMGGIHAGNIDRVQQLGFRGAAVLGSVWSHPESAVKTFKALREKCRATTPQL